MNKRRIVYTKSSHLTVLGCIRFGLNEPDQTQGIDIPEDAFEELGSPETITVTIRPGDHLNTE